MFWCKIGLLEIKKTGAGVAPPMSMSAKLCYANTYFEKFISLIKTLFILYK